MGILATGEGVDKRPNILFIIADDQSLFDFKFYNPRSTLDAPVLEKLASEGMVIDGAYQMGSWVGGVCTASRHMTMSGRTLWHVPDKAGRIMTPHVNNPRMVPPDLVKHTLPAVFNRAGYDTMRTCKNGNSYDAANKLFQVRHDGTRRGGTDERGSAWHGSLVVKPTQKRKTLPIRQRVHVAISDLRHQEPRSSSEHLEHRRIAQRSRNVPPIGLTGPPVYPQSR